MKKILIILGIVFVIGIGLVVGAFAMGAGDSFFKKPEQSTEIITEEDYTSLNIKVSSDKIKIVKSEDEKTRLSYYGEKEEIITSAVEDGTLSIEITHKFSFKNIYKYNFYDNSMIIYIPKTTYNQINIEVSSGSISSDEELTSQITNISCGSGEVNIKSINADNFNFTLASGKAELNKIESNNAFIKVGSGKLKNTQIKCDSLSFIIGSGKGNLNFIDSVDLYKITAEVGSGMVKVYENNQKRFYIENQGIYGSGNKTVDIILGSGDMRLNFIK